jgi:hypothetical protein
MASSPFCASVASSINWDIREKVSQELMSPICREDHSFPFGIVGKELHSWKERRGRVRDRKGRWVRWQL